MFLESSWITAAVLEKKEHAKEWKWRRTERGRGREKGDKMTSAHHRRHFAPTLHCAFISNMYLAWCMRGLDWWIVGWVIFRLPAHIRRHVKTSNPNFLGCMSTDTVKTSMHYSFFCYFGFVEVSLRLIWTDDCLEWGDFWTVQSFVSRQSRVALCRCCSDVVIINTLWHCPWRN